MKCGSLLPVELTTTLMERHKQQAVSEIARIAMALFIRDGFDATSVEAIAAVAKCSSRTIYRHFGTKEDILFYEMADVIEELRRAIDRNLANGLDEWKAVWDALVWLSAQLDEMVETLPQRLNLWVTEPALHGRYMEYVTDCERAVADALHRHRGTTPQTDDLPWLIAAGAIGAYRVTLMYPPGKPGGKPSKQLRKALAVFGNGLAATTAASQVRKRGSDRVGERRLVSRGLAD